MGTTTIEWATHTVNPIRARNKATGAVGHFCEKVSPGCKNCYASAWNERVRPVSSRTGPGHLIGTGLAFVAENRDKVEMFLDESKFTEVFALERKAARGRTVQRLRRAPGEEIAADDAAVRLFWCDMTDMFGSWVPDEWLDKILAVCALTPHVTHIFVTKRATRMRKYFTEPLGFSLRRKGRIWTLANILRLNPKFSGGSLQNNGAWPLPNVWLIVSAERQPEADERIPELLATPAAVRGVSLEPLLGRIDLRRFIGGSDGDCDPQEDRPLGSCVRCGLEIEEGVAHECPAGFGPSLDWLIPGGESSHCARPCAVEWIESIVEQGVAAGVAVFPKQTGSYTVSESRTAPAEMMSHPERLAREDFAPNGEVWAWRAGLGQDKKGSQLQALPPEARIRQFPEARQ